MKNRIENQCYLCNYFTTENSINECKRDYTILKNKLDGCPYFKLREQIVGYFVKVSSNNSLHKVNTEDEVKALIAILKESHVISDDMQCVIYPIIHHSEY